MCGIGLHGNCKWPILRIIGVVAKIEQSLTHKYIQKNVFSPKNYIRPISGNLAYMSKLNWNVLRFLNYFLQNNWSNISWIEKLKLIWGLSEPLCMVLITVECGRGGVSLLRVGLEKQCRWLKYCSLIDWWSLQKQLCKKFGTWIIIGSLNI